jgi:hypothetical protein
MQGAILGQPFDGGDLLSFSLAQRERAGTDSNTVDVHSARSALCDAAAVFGASKADLLPQCPKQWRVGVGIDIVRFTVHRKMGHSSPP